MPGFRDQLVTHFNQGELQNLAHDLSIKYDELPGDTLSSKARELIAYCERHGRTQELVELCQKLRPRASWDLDKSESARSRVLHNLPQGNYGRFVGRDEEMKRVLRILRPYPHSQHALITIDGIGGIGKSTLALEVAHHYRHNSEQLPVEERFEAIIWTSAKQTTLTAEGIKSRRQTIRTLDDIYNAIARTLQREDINRAQPEEQAEVVRHALAQQRTLLIVDNLETIDDDAVLDFLHELPAPTKAIVATRHRIDVAFPVRLSGMLWEDAQMLIEQVCAEKLVKMDEEQARRLFDRTGGVPLAIVWCIAQMSFGYSVAAVLTRLGQPPNDIIKFCFEAALSYIQNKPAHKLLMALSLFVPDGSREALGYVAELPELDRDEGLVMLEKLSLVNKKGDRFSLLPLTKTMATAELNKEREVTKQYGRRWVNFLENLYVHPAGRGNEYRLRFGSQIPFEDGENILAAIQWSYEQGTADDLFLLTISATQYLDVAGRWNTLFELNHQAYKLAKTIQNPLLIVRLGHLKAWLLEQRGHIDEAEKITLENLKLFSQVEDKEAEAIQLQRLSNIYRKQGDFVKAEKVLSEAQVIADQLAIGDLQALIDTTYGKLARDRGNWEKSWEYFTKVKDWFEKRTEQTPRDEDLAIGTWGHLAIVAYHLGRPQEAKELCLSSVTFFEGFGTKGYLATLKYRLALAEEALGEKEAALVHVKEAIEWYERLGMKPDIPPAKTLLQRLETSES